MNEENLEILKNYINEKIEKYVENTVVSVDTANIPKVNYWCGYIKALEDLKDFLGIKEDE
jgi:hypothetical protein